MFGKNLKYYRLKKGLSKRKLAEILNISPMSITHYENEDRTPDMDTIKALAAALDVRVSDFLVSRSANLTFRHAEFRKNASLPEKTQELAREEVEGYLSNFMTVVDILGGDVLPDAPECHVIPLAEDDEQNAVSLRRHLGFSKDGPIEGLIGQLENKGILFCEFRGGSAFSGMNGFANERPFIVVNPMMTAERNRSTIVHELSHLMFAWPESMPEQEQEKRATAISGAFLFSRSDAIRELGPRRTAVSRDMVDVAMEYGISMMMLAKRAEIIGIISKSAAQAFYRRASRMGWRTNEPPRIPAERPSLFRLLVYRAVNEEEISPQRGAELLGVSCEQVAAMCRF